MAFLKAKAYSHLFAWQLLFAERSSGKVPSELKLNSLESLLPFQHKGGTRRN